MCKRWICLASSIVVIGLAFAGGAKAADPNLIGWWPLNEGSGTTVTDLSASGTTGTINNPAGGLGDAGSVWVQDADRGTVVSFNGTPSGAYIRAGSIPLMTLTNDFTWAFWAKQDAGNTTQNDIIFGNRKDENAVDFVPRQFIKFTPTKFEWHMNGNGDDNLDYADIPADLWLYHAVVKTGAQLTYYRDGVWGGSRTITQALSFPQPLFMGGNNEAAEGENWQGSLSDARIYNRAITKVEVLAAMFSMDALDMEVGFATRAPVIDGQVDAIWAKASTQYLVPVDVNNASGSWQALYDSENLYIVVEITDDSLQNDSAGSWQDDSVEIYFDGGNSKENTALSGDNRQYTFGYGTDEIQGTNMNIEGVEQAQVDTATGWRVEIKLPWASLQGFTPQGYDFVGIDCFYNDDDDGGDSREGQIFTFATDGNAWNDASQWGTAILEPAPESVDPNMNGLVARYSFENDVNDSSGNGFNGVIVGAPTFVEGLAGLGTAMEFDGESYVDCGKDPALDITGPLSVSIWMRPGTDGTIETAPLSKADATGGWSWQLRYGWFTAKPTIMGFQFNVSDGSRAWVYVNQEMAIGEWYHVVGAYDGTTVKCYLDGVERDSAPMVGIAPSVSSLLIGSDGWRSDWVGAIDEVEVYNRALSPAEILFLSGYQPAEE
ncbi:MAG: hypothetical protein KBE65_10105 [Phycisphaerae bacterium]|nr:hypothetical protein [Phycisphaerae bacterium]